MTEPLNPALQAQPATTLSPFESAGQPTAIHHSYSLEYTHLMLNGVLPVHVEAKNGDAVVADTEPLKPELHTQPAARSEPDESAGQDTTICTHNGAYNCRSEVQYLGT